MNRSWFFVPGSNEKFLEKSKTLQADVLIFDLEDSVVQADKENARRRIVNFINNNKINKRKFVRVNDIHSVYFLDDIKELSDCSIEGIVVPKVHSRDDIQIIDYILNYYEQLNNRASKLKVMPLIESGLGIMNAYEIASASKRIISLSFGAEDYKLDVNISDDKNHSLTYARSALVNASAAANIDSPVDSIFADFNDDESLELSSRESNTYGFQGRLTIHPKQIEIVNACYGAMEQELKEARDIVDAYDDSVVEGHGALKVNGKMIDGPVAERARKLLEQNSSK